VVCYTHFLLKGAGKVRGVEVYPKALWADDPGLQPQTGAESVSFEKLMAAPAPEVFVRRTGGLESAQTV